MLDQTNDEINEVLSDELKSNDTTYNDFPWLIFTLDDQQIAISCRYITTIQNRPEDIIPSLDMPDYVQGLITVHGQITTLINTRLLFRLENDSKMTSQAERKRTNDLQQMGNMVVVLESNEMSAGFLIDDVIAVETIRIVSTAATSKTIQKSKYLYGVGTKINDESPIVLLDDKALLERVMGNIS